VRVRNRTDDDTHRFPNPALAAAITASIGLLVAAVTVPALQGLLDTQYPGPLGLVLASAASGVGYVATTGLRRAG
jgi:hypothetical protein